MRKKSSKVRYNTNPKPITRKRLAQDLKRLNKLPPLPKLSAQQKATVLGDRFTIDLLKDPPPCPDCGKKRDWSKSTGPLVHAVCFDCGKAQLFDRDTGEVKGGGRVITAVRHPCPDCGGMKMHHSDHAVGGFEICTACNGTGFKKLTIVNKGEFMKIVSDCAIRYKKVGILKSLMRNAHMNNWTGPLEDESLIPFADAVLVDFINFLGMFQGLDYGMYARDLSWENMRQDCEWENDNGCQNVNSNTRTSYGQHLCCKNGCPIWKEPA